MYKNKKIQQVFSNYDSSLEGSAHVKIVDKLLYGTSEEKEKVISMLKAKPLQRYQILPDKTFGKDLKSNIKYKVLRLIADDVIYKDINTGKVHTENINKLLARWNTEGLKEISLVTEILKVVKQVLAPLLGVFLTSVLINWIIKKL